MCVQLTELNEMQHIIVHQANVRKLILFIFHAHLLTGAIFMLKNPFDFDSENMTRLSEIFVVLLSF